jgi:hypothetical protein
MAAEGEDRSGSDSELEEAPPVKRARRAILDDDEAEMASTLTSLPQINPVEEEDIYMSEGEEEQNRNSGSGDEEEEMEQYDTSQGASDIDSSTDWGSLMDNGVRFKLLLLLSS